MQRKRPLILAHRGDSEHFPENTMAAFDGAMQAGADGIELDVRLCASGELVVFHDEHLQRLCGDSRRLADLTWAELQSCRVQGQRVPLLREVFEALPTALINVEIKQHALRQALPVVQATIRALREARALDRVVVSSFDPRLLALLRALDPDVPRALLYARTQGVVFWQAWLAVPLGVVALHPQHDLVDALALERCRAQGLRMHVWTVDEPDRIAYLSELGVDAIICNDPAAALGQLATRD